MVDETEIEESIKKNKKAGKSWNRADFGSVQFSAESHKTYKVELIAWEWRRL